MASQKMKDSPMAANLVTCLSMGSRKAVKLANQKMKDSLKAGHSVYQRQKEFLMVASLAAMRAAMLASQKLMDALKVGHLGPY